jgi:hypothetical protein
VRAACRATGVHYSTDYRHKREVERFGLEALGVRERRRPCMPNEVGAHLGQRTVAFRLAYPGVWPVAHIGRPEYHAAARAPRRAGCAIEPLRTSDEDEPPQDLDLRGAE